MASSTPIPITTAVIITVLDNDSDVDSDPLTVTAQIELSIDPPLGNIRIETLLGVLFHVLDQNQLGTSRTSGPAKIRTVGLKSESEIALDAD